MNDPIARKILLAQLKDSEAWARKMDDFAARLEIGDPRSIRALEHSVMTWNLSDRIRDCLTGA